MGARGGWGCWEDAEPVIGWLFGSLPRVRAAWEMCAASDWGGGGNNIRGGRTEEKTQQAVSHRKSDAPAPRRPFLCLSIPVTRIYRSLCVRPRCVRASCGKCGSLGPKVLLQ